MKKYFLVLISALVCSVSVYASEIKIDGVWYIFDQKTQTATVTMLGDALMTDNGALIQTPDGMIDVYEGSVIIPESVQYGGVLYRVTGIDDIAFAKCFKLQYVSIPNSVTSIGFAAFAECRGLTEITIPNGVQVITHETFWACVNLQSVAIPNTVTYIEPFAFGYCYSLHTAIIGQRVARIGQYAFRNCESLLSLVIPSSVKNIESAAFADCHSLAIIYSQAAVPPQIDEDTFMNISPTAVVYVSPASVKAYKEAPFWKDMNIQPKQ